MELLSGLMAKKDSASLGKKMAPDPPPLSGGSREGMRQAHLRDVRVLRHSKNPCPYVGVDRLETLCLDGHPVLPGLSVQL